MKKTLKIILIVLFGIITVLIMIEQSTQSKDSIPLSANEQLSPDDTGRKSEFLLLHKTLDELSKTWPESKIRPYRSALKKFPDANACLIIPNNADSINWSLINSTEELEVCLFHIHSYIGDVKQSEEWFKRQGFSVFVDNHIRGTSPMPYHTIHANWITASTGPLKNQKSPLRGPHIFFEELFAITGLSVGLTIDPEGRIIDVSCGYSRK
ncbi:MAG: hypothetical protein Q8L97_02645 [Nitrosomonas sp.]|uniref:hypothetical protein n=1 Tax=Nitrosomonas sp. TaxID=42353 RepID=UPI00272FDD66|nr:hypothetical protein [Nitrosomonas sp.]MDP1549048.1 hypothetical protein [Nitrosomonas sp.]